MHFHKSKIAFPPDERPLWPTDKLSPMTVVHAETLASGIGPAFKAFRALRSSVELFHANQYRPR
jgi:hypothetical protein